MADTDDISLLAQSSVLLPTSRELIVATGADRIRFLHGIVTADVAGTPVGGGCHSALLTPKGHVVADMRILVRPDDMAIVVDAGQGEPTAAALSRYAIMDDFVATRREGAVLAAVLGPEAEPRLASVGLGGAAALVGRPPLSHAELPTPAGPLTVVRVRELGADGFWLAGAADAVAAPLAALEQAGVPRVSPAAAEAARVAALEPRWGAEITADYFPMEVGLSGAVDYGKGCYLGQEPIVRIRDRGHINWRLVGLELGGAGAEAAAGDALESDVKPRAGRITSAARLPDGRGVALALLHVSIPVGADVRVKHGDDVLPARVTADIP